MKKLTKAVLSLKIWKDKHGQDLIEYALMAGVISVACSRKSVRSWLPPRPVKKIPRIGGKRCLGASGTGFSPRRNDAAQSYNQHQDRWFQS
jgi:hypothetical protein